MTIGLVLGPVMIRKLQALKYGQAVSSFAPENHAKKMGTPTMGGVLILLSIGISTLLWADLSNPICLDCTGGNGDLWCCGLGG